MNKNEEFGTVLATSSESATSATTISNKRAFITKYWTLAVIAILMSAVIALSSVLIVKLNGDATMPPLHDDPTTITRDFEELAKKYEDRFVDNKDGTVGLNLRSDRAFGDESLTAIDEQDVDELVEYKQTLDSVNKLINDGELVIDDDGNYYMVNSDVRDFEGGKAQFYIKTKKIFWIIPIPVGYYLALPGKGAVIFGFISWGFKVGAESIRLGQNHFYNEMRKWINQQLITMAINQLGADWIYDLLNKVIVAGAALDTHMTAVAPILNLIIKIVVSKLAGYIFDRVGYSFLSEGLRLISPSNRNNTIELNSDLLLRNRSIEAKRY